MSHNNRNTIIYKSEEGTTADVVVPNSQVTE